MTAPDVLRAVRAVLNRLSPSSLEPAVASTLRLYAENPRASVDDALAAVLTQTLRLMATPDQQALLYAAFLAALAGAKDVGVLAAFLHALHAAGLLDHAVVLVVGLHALRVLDAGLVFELLLRAVSDANADLALTIVQHAGVALRKENPKTLRDVILRAQDVYGGRELSPKEQYVVECLNSLKNNKFTGRSLETIDTLRPAVAAIWRAHGAGHVSPLAVSLTTLASASGRWWEADGAEPALSPALAQPVQSELLASAKRHHMNTDVRKAVFAALMGAEDYVDGYRRITALHLAREQDREVVAVLLYCAGRAKAYNVYYQLVAEQLLKESKGARFTMQLAFWDRMRELDEHGATAAVNWGRLLGELLAKDFLTLQVLKGMDLVGITTLGTAFVRVALQTLLLAESEDAVKHAFKRFVRLRDADSLRARKEVHLFLLKRLGKCIDPERRKLLERRRRLALRIFDAAVDEML